MSMIKSWAEKYGMISRSNVLVKAKAKAVAGGLAMRGGGEAVMTGAGLAVAAVMLPQGLDVKGAAIFAFRKTHDFVAAKQAIAGKGEANDTIFAAKKQFLAVTNAGRKERGEKALSMQDAVDLGLVAGTKSTDPKIAGELSAFNTAADYGADPIVHVARNM